MIGVFTLDTTWTFRFTDGEGGWLWYSQQEYATKDEARDIARNLYDGFTDDEIQLIRIDRTVI